MNAIATPATSSSPKPRTIGTGESNNTSIAADARDAGRGDRRRAGRGRVPYRATASIVHALGKRLLHARLELDRIVHREPHQHRQHSDRATVSDAPTTDSAPNVSAAASSAIANGNSRGRPEKIRLRVPAITSITATSSISIECVILPVKSATITGSPVTR